MEFDDICFYIGLNCASCSRCLVVCETIERVLAQFLSHSLGKFKDGPPTAKDCAALESNYFVIFQKVRFGKYNKETESIITRLQYNSDGPIDLNSIHFINAFFLLTTPLQRRIGSVGR